MFNIAGLVVERVILEASAVIQAKRQLEAILSQDSIIKPPVPGFVRGIDFYKRSELPRVAGSAFYKYFKANGHFPNLEHPLGYNEKIVWSKFFRPMKVPESGNKLLTSRFIPEEMKGQVSCPEIVWHSTSTTLPDNDMIEPGFYYLKANHGSGYYERIAYPLTTKEKSKLENKCKKWLRINHGLSSGEWWYSAFTKEIMLERDVVETEDSLSWNIVTFKGNIARIHAFRKEADQSLAFDGEMQLLPIQSSDKKPLPSEFVTANTTEYVANTLLPIAQGIGRPHNFLRVDLFIGKDNKPYLNEITFTPCNGTCTRPAEDEYYLGELWDL